MDLTNVEALSDHCLHFLNGHGPRSVRQICQDVADSPLSLQRNDHYGRGGFVTELEKEVAELLGKEAAVIMPSGTMAQPIALRIWSDRVGVRNVAFHPTCHLELHEFKAYRELHGLNALLLGEADRLFTLADLRAIDEPISTLLIELPQREIGGQLPTWEELVEICDAARAKGMKLHMDGARFWECAPFYGRSYSEIAALFDSVYVSFYKILQGLPGAALAGPASVIEEARIWQRRQGGNLQQQSPSAIAAKLGMEKYLPKMSGFVAKAGEIAEALRSNPRVRIVPEYPPTNMMHLYLSGDPERLTMAARQVMAEDRVALFFGVGEGGKLEVSTGDGLAGLEAAEVSRLFEKVFALADQG
jgi:threonine aldolase